MRFETLVVRLAFALCAVALGAHAADAPLSVTELVARNIEAKGGADALKALGSLKLSGKMLVNQDTLELGFVQIYKLPSSVREESSIQGLTQIQAFNGTDGWQINPFQGRKDPERMSADDIKGLAEELADFDGPLVNAAAKGNTIEFLGTEDVDGTLAHKLKVTRKNGEVKYVFLDPDHFLEIRTLSQRIERGAQVETQADIGDYEKVAGVYVPMSIEVGLRGSREKQKILFEKAEPNLALDDALFAFPAPAVKPTGASAPN
jgi:hypothetical protein